MCGKFGYGAWEMILRPVTPSDAAELAEMGRSSFCAAFEHLYDPADLAAFLGAHKTEQSFAAIIANPARRTMLAEADGRIVGYCILGLESEFSQHSDAAHPLALQQLYTDPASTGQGIGATLMEWALDEAKSRVCDAIQLSVWSENFGAQRFYGRYGFSKIADIEFWVGKHRDEEFLFELRL